MQRTETNPDDVIGSLPEPVRDDIRRLDAAISPVMDGLPRDVWEGPFWGGTQQRIIGYGRYTYRGRSGAEGEWFIVGLASQKNYLSLYVNGAEDGMSLAKRYAERLGKVKASSGAVTFKRLADVDLDVVVELVRRARELASS
ncbi:MAG TPA: DUF1801 domain-containing protein [Candidatus Limnocylindria bacterium]|nr:DUF1801 domain-containing protein [Candidatus Limnocylindria bacterium]